MTRGISFYSDIVRLVQSSSGSIDEYMRADKYRAGYGSQWGTTSSPDSLLAAAQKRSCAYAADPAIPFGFADLLLHRHSMSSRHTRKVSQWGVLGKIASIHSGVYGRYANSSTLWVGFDKPPRYCLSRFWRVSGQPRLTAFLALS